MKVVENFANQLFRTFTGTIGTGDSSRTQLSEDSGQRSKVKRGKRIGELVFGISAYVDGAIADELELLDEWGVEVEVNNTTVLTIPLGECRASRPAIETNGGLTTGQTEWVRPGGRGRVADVLLPSEEDSVRVYVYPLGYAAGAAPAADTEVGINLHFREAKFDEDLTG